MSLDLSSLSGLTANLGSLLPSPTAIVEQIALGAAVSTVTKGIAAGGLGSLDPLGLFPHPANNPAASPGPTITASAFSSLDANAKASLLASGVHVIAG